MIALLALLVAGAFLNYIDRGNLSIAAPMLKNELGISPEQLGLLLSAFFWTYTVLQPLAGWIVDRFEVAYVMAAGFFLWSAATAATGFVHAFAMLFIARLVLGVGESIAYPSYSKVLMRHFPEERRAFANSLITSGISLGPAFGIFAGGLLMAKFGWRPFFIVLGLISMLWLPAWLAAIPREKAAPAETRGESNGSNITVGQFLCRRAAWGACIGHFASNYLSYFLITWLPYYLVRQRGFSMQQMAKIGAFAYLMGALAAAAAGWLSDHWVRRGGDSSRIRKSFAGGGMAASAVLLMLAARASNASTPLLLTATVISFCTCGSHIFVIAQALGGREAAGRWTGLQNCAGNFAGPLAPALTGFVVQRTGDFSLAFAIAAAIQVAGALAWTLLLPRIEEVKWSAAVKTASAVQVSGQL